MSYVPLHHKYRPQTFAQLVGQTAITTTLSNALAQERIAPAYLFTGARGTGKTSSARIFAKSLNCMAGDKPTSTPCGTCETCVGITRGNALDVIEIDAASNTGVDNIRELIERAQFAPVQCRYKVYIVDECHMLTSAAFNALLKTLEEPPDRVVFVLATTDPQRVLPTIISRCQRFDFRRIPLDDMSGHLTHIAQVEAIAIAPDAVQLIAQIAQGGLRDAESLLDQLSLMDGEVTIEKVWDLVGAVPERDLMILTQAIFADDARLTIDTTRHLMDRGREPLIVLQNLASFYRDLLIAKTAPDRADLVPVTAPTWVQMCEFAKVVSGKGLLAGQQQLRSAEVQLKHSTQPRLWLEITLLGLMPSAVGVEAVQSAPVVNNVRSVAPTPIAVAPPTPTVAPIAAIPIASPPSIEAPPKAAPKPPLEPGAIDLEATWQSILDNLGLASTKGIIAPNCFLMDVNESTVKIGIRGKQMVPIVKAQLEKLSKSCAKTLNLKSVKLSLVVTDPTPKNNSTAAPPNPQANLTKPENELPPPPPPRSAAPPVTKPADRPPTDRPPTDRPAATIPDDRDATSEAWSPDHPVTRAAKSLADAFNGAIVDLNEPLEALETEAGMPETVALDDTIEAGLSEIEHEIDPDQKNDTDDDDSSINVPF